MSLPPSNTHSSSPTGGRHVLWRLSPNSAPSLLAIQDRLPDPAPRAVIYVVGCLFSILLIWSFYGKLDIVASAEGRLVPQNHVQIVQPAEGGIVRQILVSEGEHVAKGQVLMEMDAQDAQADGNSIGTELALRSLQLRRIDAEMNNTQIVNEQDDPIGLFKQIYSQYLERHRAYLDNLGQAKDGLEKTQRDFDSGQHTLIKLQEVVPTLAEDASAFQNMAKDGFVSTILVREKQRAYTERLQDLRAQKSNVESLAAAVASANKLVAQVTSKYRSDLQNERVDAEAQYQKVQLAWSTQQHKLDLMGLKAPQSGIAKDLATHTLGTVVSPGTVMLSLVPDNEPLTAEIMIKNEDVGFVRPHQKVKLKVSSFPFQQYGMIDGEVLTIGADSNDGANKPQETVPLNLVYKATIALDAQQLRVGAEKFPLIAGMQVVAEIAEGKRSVIQYILSPIQKTFTEGARER